jgi:hypothetical protein
MIMLYCSEYQYIPVVMETKVPITDNIYNHVPFPFVLVLEHIAVGTCCVRTFFSALTEFCFFS